MGTVVKFGATWRRQQPRQEHAGTSDNMISSLAESVAVDQRHTSLEMFVHTYARKVHKELEL